MDDECNTMSDNSDLIGRFKRYAAMTTSLSSTAARQVAERFLGVEIDHAAQAKTLTQALGQLKGPVMKIAQFLATVPDAIPEEYTQAFTALQANAPPMGELFVKRRMRAELGVDWQQKFAHFNLQSVAAASLGQVHIARHHDGQKLACKLQYPDMASIIDADLNQLKLFLKIYESTIGALSLDEVFTEISERLWEELDYQREAQHIHWYQQIFKDHGDIRIPKICSELSTNRLLTMSWMQGQPLKDIQQYPQEFRNKLAATLFESWYRPFYHYGIIHGDPHLGNYSVTDDGHINLFDFGCIRVFNGHFVASVIDLYRAFLHNDADRAVEAYRRWGFQNLSKEMIDVLNLWAKMLYEPLLDDRVRTIHKTNRGLEGRAVAEHVHKELRRLGGVKPPREFVFMDRAAVGIGAAFMHLQAENNWHQLLENLIQDFDAEQLQQRQNNITQL